MRVRISEPGLMASLVETLRKGDCILRTVREGELDVTHTHAESEAVARMELRFFLRAWQSQHGPDVHVDLVG
jgi:hypothetical protein